MNLDLATIKNTALWVLIGLAVVALVLAIIIKKIIGKVITLVLAAVIVFFGWQQRAKIIDYVNNTTNSVTADVCKSAPTFFGIKVNLPGC